MYYQNGPRSMEFIVKIICLNTVLVKKKKGVYIINLDEYFDIRTHWVALHVNNKTVIANIFRIQAYDSIMRGHFCIGFIDFMFHGNSLTDFTNLFSPNNFKKMMI